MKKVEKQDLAQFLADNCEYVDSDEQKEIDEIMKKLEMDTAEGKEIFLNKEEIFIKKENKK